MKKQLKKNETSLHLDKDYKNFLSDIKDRLKTAQIRAALAANSELVKFYWQLGCDLIEGQKKYEWGDGFLIQFSNDLRNAFPGMQGFSVTNLKRMRILAKTYPKSPQPVDQLPWGHISLLIHAVKDDFKREWYAAQTIKNGWSRAVLEMQIENGLYERQAILSKKVTNYQEHLPVPQSDLANEMLKDPYNFDFLTIHADAHERVIEDALISHVRDFLLELGQGFAFVGSQVPLTFDDQEFFVDLLFYHIKLKCYVVIELKATKFKPEHTGQLGFYLEAVDDQLRNDGDNKTIGILLCKSKNKVVAEYAVRSSKAPIGISEFTLLKSLPTELENSLPTIEQIEAELNDEVVDNIAVSELEDNNAATYSLEYLNNEIEVARKGLSEIEADWAVLQVIYPFAYQLNEVLTKEMNVKIAVQKIKLNPFVKWLNDARYNFYQAKQKMIENGFLPYNDVHPESIDELRNKCRLEYVCSSVIRFFMDSKIKLSQVPALKSDHKKIVRCMQYVRNELERLGTIYFQNDILQHLMLYCIDELLKGEQRNVFSTGKAHDYLPRELMIKRTIQLLYTLFEEHEISDDFVCNIAVTIGSHFFTMPMELKEVKDIAREIKQYKNEAYTLMNKKIDDVLREYTQSKSIAY